MKEKTYSKECNILKQCEKGEFKDKAREIFEKTPKEEKFDLYIEVKYSLVNEAMKNFDKESELNEIRKELKII